MKGMLTMDIKEKEALLHKSRIAFALVNDQMRYLTNSEMSHKEWLQLEFNISDEDFENIIRGTIKDNKIYFYIGSDFKTIEELESKAATLTKTICEEQNLQLPTEVYCGMIIGEIGQVWSTIHTIKVPTRK